MRWKRVPLMERYRPRSLAEIAGQGQAVQRIKEWMEEAAAGSTKKALLIVGPPGTGKTSAAYAIASEMDLEPIEINAGDERASEILERVIYSSSSSPLEGRGRIIILDEVDAYGGGYSKLGRLVRDLLRKKDILVVMTANNAYERGLAELRALSTVVKFSRLRWQTINKVLKRIAEAEGMSLPDEAIVTLAKRSSGDLRAAINDLEVAAAAAVEPGMLESLIGDRDVQKTIFDLLNNILFWGKCLDSRRLMYNVDVDVDMVLRWVEENVPRAYQKPETLNRAYRRISQADVLLGRIIRSQNYSLLSYAQDLITIGVCAAKRETGERPKYVRLQFPSYIKTAASMSSKRKEVGKVAAAIARKTHTSTEIVKRDLLPLLALLVERELGALKNLALDLNVDPKSLKSMLRDYMPGRAS